MPEISEFRAQTYAARPSSKAPGGRFHWVTKPTIEQRNQPDFRAQQAAK